MYFPQILFFYQKSNDLSIYNQDVQKEDIHLPDFYYLDLGYHASCFVFTLPKSNHLQNLLTPKDNLLNETIPEKIDLFSINIFKLPQETLIKTAINIYIKNLIVSFVNENYFLYYKSIALYEALSYYRADIYN